MGGLASGDAIPTKPPATEPDAPEATVSEGPLWALPEAARGLVAARNIRALCLANNDLCDADVALVCQAIRALSAFETLDLSSNARLSSRGAAAVSQLLDTRASARARPAHILSGAGVSSLRELFLDGVPLGDGDGAEALLEALAANDTLRVLSACSCGIGGHAGERFRAMLFSNATLRSLLLTGNRCALHQCRAART